MFTHFPRPRLWGPGDLADSAGGLYNPGAWRTDAGAVALILRREAQPPPYTTSVAPVLIPALTPQMTPAALAYRVACVGYHAGLRLEDFRPCVFAGQTLVTHTTVDVAHGLIQPMLSTLAVDAGVLTRQDDLALPLVTQPVEKNWVLLPDQVHDALRLVYALDPLLIYTRQPTGWVRTTWQPTDWTRALGKPPRNSCHLIPFAAPTGEPGWLGWWHTLIDRTYVQGAYWLDGACTLRARTGILFNGQAVHDGFKPGCLYLSSQVDVPAETSVALYFGEGDAYTAWTSVSYAALHAVLFPSGGPHEASRSV